MWLSSSAVCERYRSKHNQPISLRTLHRWVTRKRIPPPTKIGLRNYWPKEQLDAHDAARLLAAHAIIHRFEPQQQAR